MCVRDGLSVFTPCRSPVDWEHNRDPLLEREGGDELMNFNEHVPCLILSFLCIYSMWQRTAPLTGRADVLQHFQWFYVDAHKFLETIPRLQKKFKTIVVPCLCGHGLRHDE